MRKLSVLVNFDSDYAHCSRYTFI